MRPFLLLSYFVVEINNYFTRMKCSVSLAFYRSIMTQDCQWCGCCEFKSRSCKLLFRPWEGKCDSNLRMVVGFAWLCLVSSHNNAAVCVNYFCIKHQANIKISVKWEKVVGSFRKQATECLVFFVKFDGLVIINDLMYIYSNPDCNLKDALEYMHLLNWC